MNAIGFFHVATIGMHVEVDAELLGLIRYSRLLECLEGLKIGVVGDQLFTPLFHDPKIEISNFGEDPRLYEFPTLQWLQETAKSWDGYIFYCNNKGVTRDRLDSWRYLVAYHNIARWKECVAGLDEGYDCVGIEWLTEPTPHFAGNFWWARTDYLRTLPPIETEGKELGKRLQEERHGAEFWIGMGNPRIKSLYQTGHVSWKTRPAVDWFVESLKGKE